MDLLGYVLSTALILFGLLASHILRGPATVSLQHKIFLALLYYLKEVLLRVAYHLHEVSAFIFFGLFLMEELTLRVDKLSVLRNLSLPLFDLLLLLTVLLTSLGCENLDPFQFNFFVALLF